MSTTTNPPTPHRIYSVSFASVWPAYIAKAQRKGRTEAEVEEIILWLTGYTREQFQAEMAAGTTFEDFYTKAPMNPARRLITGVVCGVRVEELTDPVMQNLRYFDKLVDELAKGRPMEKILRSPA